MNKVASWSTMAIPPVAPQQRREMAEDAAARIVDVSVAATMLLILLPLMVLIGLWIYLEDRGPIFFAHRRIGRNGREFPCLKFRSMATDSDARLQALLAHSPVARSEWQRDHKLKDDPRITRAGALLRKTSLDELPQLFNVLRNEMSLVGPRPIVTDEIRRYGRYFAFYCAQRPGITGLWQVSGRSDTSYRRRVALDVAYSRSKSLRLDMLILVRTVPAILAARGSY